MITTKTKESGPISKLLWVYISGVAFLISFSAAAILIFFADKLEGIGIADNIYYLILIPLGLCASAFLFGAMKSYGQYKFNGPSPYGRLSISGPITVFVLVVVGGFALPRYIKNDVQSFDLKVRVFSSSKATNLFNDGIIMLYLGKDTYTANIHEGEVEFPNIPINYRGKIVKIIPALEDYELAGSDQVTIPLAKDIDNIDIELVQKPEAVSTQVRGTIFDEQGVPLENAFINIASGLATCTTDKNGDFKLIVPRKEGEKLPLVILLNKKVKLDRVITISSITPLRLKIDTAE